MRCKLSFIIAVSLLLILAACGKAECKTNIDCNRPHFSGVCEDKKCVYTPIPNQCGNLQCETGENKCSCPTDCGNCAGKAANSKYLTQQCVNNECLESVSESQISPIYGTTELSAVGDKYILETNYNQPFNLKKDLFTVSLTLSTQAPANSDTHIQNIELTATTADRRTITLARQDVDKYLWSQGSTITEELILDFPTAETESELTNLILKVNYEYAVTQAGKKTLRQTTIQNRYKEKFEFVNPSGTYPCPASCDDKNPGTRDYCGPQTNSFCKHDPIPNACGNYKCDGNENRCSCPQDCGQCSGSAGSFLDFTCKTNNCITILKAGTNIQPNTLFDDRSLGPVQLHNNYKYNTPFNVNEDEFVIELKVYRQDPTVEDATIETIRFLSGANQIAELAVNQKITEDTTSVSVKIPPTNTPEEEHQLTLSVWYKYTQSGTEKTGKFDKPLGKITFINPG